MIEVSVLNSKMERKGILDNYTSFIWTDRYNEAGDFELCIPITAKYADKIAKDDFLRIPTSNKLMIVESIKTTTDVDDGNIYEITGRSLEVILDRRIVWKQTQVAGSIQNAIHSLLTDSFINPTDSRRRVDNFVFIESTDPNVTHVTYSEVAQYMGDSVYDVVKKVCQAFHLGFQIVYENGQYKFSLFAGTDRSYDQHTNQYVVFSPNHDNLRNSKYLESLKNYKNVLRIAGEGEGATKTYITHYMEFDDDKASEKTGLDRREIYLDCSDVSSITDSNTTMDVAQYTNVLVQKGVEKLVELAPETAFEGEIDTTVMFKYHQDFEVGDLCEIRNEFGMSDQVRIAEVVQTWEPSGYSCIPTLQSLKDEELESSSGGGGSSTTIIETVDTVSIDRDTAALKVVWMDKWGSGEDATVTYLTHSMVKMDTQLMRLQFYEGSGQWRIMILMDHTTVYNKVDGTTTVYNRGRTINWPYSELVNLEVSHTS